MSIGGFSVRKVPLNFCAMHGQVGVYAEDGTERWHCRSCVSDATWYAERILRLDREIHLGNHAGRRVARCPYCDPGHVA